MRTKLVSLGFAAALAATVFGLSAPSAMACSDSGPHGGGAPVLAGTPDGGAVYGAQDGIGGYIGIAGSHGYIEAYGGVDQGGGGIQGSSTDAPVSGYLSVDGSGPHVCVNGTGAP